MNGRHRVTAVALAGALMLCGLQAHAFFPWGDFTEQGQLRFLTWPLEVMDANNDGDVSGDDEGVLITFEDSWTQYVVDPGSGEVIPIEMGWTVEEMDVLTQAFDVWENVPTSYVSFAFTNPIVEPLIVPSFDSDIIISEPVYVDFVNYIAVQEEGIGDGILGITLMTALSEDIVIDYNGVQLPLTGGRILECDIVISGPAHRPQEQGTEAAYSLLGTQVHEIGHMIGLGHTPLNNFSEIPPQYPRLLERPAGFDWINPQGDVVDIGVTPTMFPFIFYLDDGTSNFPAGQEDLAPDDISGVSFLYPRGSQDAFFDIESEARTQTTNGIPSLPLPGGHVVAWSDADNVLGTKRVPMFSTMTGLYENQALQAGLFKLKGLLKQHGPPLGEFDATYTITIAPLNGRDVTGYPPEAFDSTHILPGGAGQVYTFNPAFPSEVFHESIELFGVDNREQGTPLYFHNTRNRIVSANSGIALNTLVSASQPMFGDPNDVCLMNVAVAGLVSTNSTDLSRKLRDNFLLSSAAGAAFIDAYYRASPTVARFLLDNAGALAFVRGLFASFEWVYAHAQALALAVFALLAVMVGFNLRRRHAAALTALALVAGLALLSVPASAQIADLSTPEVVALSDDIVVGKVSNVQSRWAGTPTADGPFPGLRIVTDITIAVEDTVKGRLNKSSKVFLCQPGGRVGPISTVASCLANFKKGEEVLLFLQNGTQGKRIAPLVVAGERGKYLVKTDKVTGEKRVYAGSLAARFGLADAQKAIESESAEDGDEAESAKKDGGVALGDLTEYLRDVVKDQE